MPKARNRNLGRWWWLGVLVAVAAVAAFVWITAHYPSPPKSKVPSAPAKRPGPSTSSSKREVPIYLGSYGASVQIKGETLALQIHPIATLLGPAKATVPTLDDPSIQEIIANLFLRFPNLHSLQEDPALQRQLSQSMAAALEERLRLQHSPWKIKELHLHITLGPIPK